MLTHVRGNRVRRRDDVVEGFRVGKAVRRACCAVALQDELPDVLAVRRPGIIAE